MPNIQANGISMYYETHGNPNNPALLLIQGLSMSSAAWPPEMIAQWVAKGFYVISFDNRDIGKSQLMDQLGKPNIAWQVIKLKLGLRPKSGYSLLDMANDAAGLLDALEVNQAHVVGVSMGGMIGQLLSAEHPDKVLSFTSIMSTSGKKGLLGTRSDVAAHLRTKPASTELADIIAFQKKSAALLTTPEHPLDGEALDAHITRVLTHGMTSSGILRQMCAIVAGPARTSWLERIQAPTLVIHGDVDPLVNVEGGIDVAKTVPGAKLEIIKNWGHDLPPSMWTPLVELTSEHALSAAE
ncbi:alpha/beta hydrolase [uncultured Umboniibacter sp.]|uniref:alpha/beta fold hydrolase n=1 Tax=uncultured Umboniibacter sp. TaxID=1798917 RepID=UPI00261FF7BC|nr:alpha/beta hydrolase [uncultured Umboniibacter sp.]